MRRYIRDEHILTTGQSEPNRPVKYFCSYMVINRCALHFVHKLRKKATCHYILTLGHPQRRHRNNTTASRLLQRLFFYCMHACMSAWVDGKMAHFAAFDFTHQLLLTLGHRQRHHRNNATTSCMHGNQQSTSPLLCAWRHRNYRCCFNVLWACYNRGQ